MDVQSMKILIISPMELPYTGYSKYTGIERLAAQFADEIANRGLDVTLLAHKAKCHYTTGKQQHITEIAEDTVT